MKMSVKNEIGDFCLTMEASFELVKRIKLKYKEGEVLLDFSDISLFATPFFNGLIHGFSQITDINNLKCSHLPSHGLIAYEHAVKNFIENKVPAEDIKKAMLDYLESQKVNF